MLYYDYLNDSEFLKQLSEENLKSNYIKFIILSQDEKPIQEIQSIIYSGTLSINGNSTVRRTISLSAVIDLKEYDIEKIKDLFSLNKKIKIETGYKNILKNYQKYGEVIWFPCGTFVITSLSIQNSTSEYKISITGQDKMVTLNGMVGGVLQANTTFDTTYVEDSDGNIIAKKIKIIDIIREAVNHLGGEDLNKIQINDLEETAKELIKYNGETPIHFSENYSSFIISEQKPDGYIYTFNKNDNIGYRETDLIYPNELILEAGQTITNLLDELCSILGNYEYFYDVYGNFIFQEIKNYMNTKYSLTSQDTNGENYIKYFSDSKYLYSLFNSKTNLSISNVPKLENIKNDFVIW